MPPTTHESRTTSAAAGAVKSTSAIRTREGGRKFLIPNSSFLIQGLQCA